MKKKLKSRRGVTLTELLVALALLGLLSAVVVTGISSSLRMYRQSVTLSRAQTTLSTLVSAVGNAVRMGHDGPPSITLDGASGQLLRDGKLLVGDGVYSDGSLRVEHMQLKDLNDGVYALSLTVRGASGVSVSAETRFRQLNYTK